MDTPLQNKDDHWRSRPNGATPVADPGLAPLGSDDEAGGASSNLSATTGPARAPLPTSPDRNEPGVRVPPKAWYAVAGILAGLFIVAALWSIFA